MPEHIKQDSDLLAALPAESRARLIPHLKLVRWRLGQVILEHGDAVRSVYFPLDAMVALLVETQAGSMAEISLIGNEGIVGVAAVLGGGSSPSRAVVCCAGHAYRLPAEALDREFSEHSELLALLLRYTQVLMTQMAQTAVCNRYHSIEQQLCRLLLLVLDHRPGNELKMTQELIANLLGVRREGVTLAASRLRKIGAIDYARGRIQVLQRAELERLACECYAVVRRETDRILPCGAKKPALVAGRMPPSRTRRPEYAGTGTPQGVAGARPTRANGRAAPDAGKPSTPAPAGRAR